jgi:hypothetical protein
MSNRPRRHRRANRPAPRLPWTIQGVVGDGDRCQAPGCHHDHATDPDFVEFAYTNGLHKLGLPELYMSCRSVDGDTGSIEMVADALNWLAAACVADELHPGDQQRSAACDRHGHTTVYTLGPASGAYRNQLEAFQTHPRAEVIPVTWTVEET